MNKKERVICKFEINFCKSFLLVFLRLSNDDLISWRPGLKTGLDFRGAV